MYARPALLFTAAAVASAVSALINPPIGKITARAITAKNEQRLIIIAFLVFFGDFLFEKTAIKGSEIIQRIKSGINASSKIFMITNSISLSYLLFKFRTVTY